MVTISLDPSVREGFGPLLQERRAGSLRASLGLPEASNSGGPEHLGATMWRYGDAELHFDAPEGQLWLFHIDQFTGRSPAPGAGRSPRGWGGLAVDPWIFHSDLTEAVFVSALRAQGVSYTARLAGTENELIVAGLQVYFNAASGALSAISRRL